MCKSNGKDYVLALNLYGCFRYSQNLFKPLHSIGFKGIVGSEHGNLRKGKEGELAAIEAYESVDKFWANKEH